jgi:DNA-directed RNA polymerase subunit M/transcription elongation factor TFIIS
MFKIPTEHDISTLSPDQKTDLEISINEFKNNYISNNRLSIELNNIIALEKYLNIRFNLINSPSLLERINTNQIDIKSLPWMDPHELDSTLWQSHIDKRNKNRDTIDKMATTNIFKCRKCGEMKCTTYQLQTASIDEPMTTFIHCKVCGNSWKV